MKTLGDRLTELREANKFTKAEMAQKLGVNKSTITRYETNEIKPNLDMLIKMSEIFGVTLDWIAGLENNEKDDIKKKKSAYIPLINECIENNIEPDHLRKVIDLLRGLKG